MATKKIQISVSIDNDLYEALIGKVENREIASISHGVNRAVYLYLKDKGKGRDRAYAQSIGAYVGGGKDGI